MTTRRSVLHVLTPGLFGGLEEVVRQLASAQRAAGTDARCGLLAAPGWTPPMEEELRDAGVPVERIETRRRAYIAERAAVRGLIARLRPDIVHTHGYRADVLHGSVARKQGLATVTTLHGFTGGDRKNQMFEWLQVRAARRTGCAVAVSRPIAERLVLAGVDRARVRCIPNARGPAMLLDREEARRRLGVNAKGPLLGWIGRLSGEKGPDVLLDALSYLPIGTAHVVLVGDGPDLLALRAQASALGLVEQVHFAGVVARAASCMAAFDALVLSSRTEGVPMVLVEAMQANLPVVATRVGGVPDMLSDAEAFLVPSGAPEKLAHAMTEALNRPDEAARRATLAAARAVRDFGMSQWVERYDSAYDLAIEGRGRRDGQA